MRFQNIIRKMYSPGESLSQRAIRSGFWASLSKIAQQMLGFIRTIVIARILAPEEIGLMGVALLTMSMLTTFSETGFQQALIQRKNNIEPYLDSAWTILIIRGVILFIIIYFIAPYAAIFYDAPSAEAIIRVTGFSFIILALTNIGVIYYQKELEFNKEFVYQFIGTLSEFLITISFIFVFKNIWAIVFGLLAGNIARCLLSYLINPYRPHICFDLSKAKELFSYGRWILGATILAYLINQGDNIFVGRFLGMTALGLYAIAYNMSHTPATLITNITTQVALPVYSKIQDDTSKIRDGYLNVLKFSAFLIIPICGLIILFASEFTKLVLGDKWIPMIPTMQLLAVAALIRSLSATSGPLFYAVGKPEIVAKWQPVRLIVLAILIYPLTLHWGIIGTPFAVIICDLVSFIGFSIKIIDLIKCTAFDLVSRIALPAFYMIIVMIIIEALKRGFIIEGMAEFIILGLISIITYIFMIFLSDKKFLDDIKQYINNI